MPAKQTADTRAHLEWLGFVQPRGLVVSTPALSQAGAVLNRNDSEGQSLLRDCVDEGRRDPCIRDFEAFARSVLDWSFHKKFYFRAADRREVPEYPEVHLPDFGEVMVPDYAIRHRKKPSRATSEWQLLVRTVGPGQGFDAPEAGSGKLDATAHGRLERLLRGTGVQAGLLFNGRAVRLVSAPRGESSGWLDFRVSDMLETPGRPIVAAMRLLLGEARLLRVPEHARLTALLEKSRQFQNVVSERLAEQVLQALYELVRGLQDAHDRSGGHLLRDVLERDRGPDEVYRGLLTVILRMVFLLYAEQRDLMPEDEVFAKSYSLGGLYERLQRDDARHPATMDFRYGAWAQVVVLFRMIHDGARSGAMRLPAREGSLFDPERFRFLSEAPAPPGQRAHGRTTIPLVPDGTVYRVLEKLLVLDGERISYRALDVEQIGSVYETMMGFQMQTASGLSIAIKAPKKNGAPSTIDLEALLAVNPSGRWKWIQGRTDRKITAKVNRAVKAGQTVNDLHAALEPVLDRDATPDLVKRGAMVLQPGRERRASGSHYTPRSLTEPIVRKTLQPLFDSLTGTGTPTAEAVLSIKVCDPAMGSGAFLVEACRQLGDALLDAWRAHGRKIVGLTGEDEVVVARRVVAQSCLYGVDRNPVAVDLAKMSLWLATLAKDYPLTFLDHSLRHGDSLLGLGRRQIEGFHWHTHRKHFQPGLEAAEALNKVDRAAALRSSIQAMDPSAPRGEFLELWEESQRALADVRLLGDLVLSAFFEGTTNAKREKRRKKYSSELLTSSLGDLENPLASLRFGDKPLASFHWEMEFPEVFDREWPGFDAIVGNPPFAGKNPLINGNRPGYLAWLKTLHASSHGNADLAAHFFRRAFSLLRDKGNFGLVATNTIAQGDTRSTGLRFICKNGGAIYDATRRLKWPGQAAVVVSVVHIAKRDGAQPSLVGYSSPATKCVLDGSPVESISAFLVPGTMHNDPTKLRASADLSFIGSFVHGMGFTFDDTDRKGVASTLQEMNRLLESNPANRDVIQPFIAGAELNASPTHAYHRYVINFHDYPLRRDAELRRGWADVISEAEDLAAAVGFRSQSTNHVDAGSCRGLLNQLRGLSARASDLGGPTSKAVNDCRRLVRAVREWSLTEIVPADYPHPVAADWPELLAIVREKVYPARSGLRRKALRERWWHYAEKRPRLYGAIRGLRRVLVVSAVGQHMAFGFLPANYVYAHRLAVFPLESFAAFCALQSRLHEIWVRRFGSTLKDDLCYNPSDCFETFPFPEGWSSLSELEAVGREYYEFRASLMERNNEGLTKAYNRFHDFYEDNPSIRRLRELHDRMDKVVLSAYGWKDLPVSCDFREDLKGARRKRRYRYRWSDRVEEEVLGRLLDLNASEARQQAL